LLGVFGQGQRTTDAVLQMVDDLGSTPSTCSRAGRLRESDGDMSAVEAVER
jgi:hypothetical protein